MKKLLALSLLAAIFCMAATPTAPKLGTVSFRSCVEGSKLGKKEQAQFEEMKKQFEAAMDVKEKELNDMAPKFTDDYMDTLTPEAEADMKTKFAKLNQELQQMQNQYYDLLGQANSRIIQKMYEAISKAAEKVAKAKGFEGVMNDEAFFYHVSGLDISKEVIADMDLAYDQAAKEAAKQQEKK